MASPKAPRPLRVLLLLLGAVVAPAIAALGVFGLHDLSLVAEARLRSDATVRARAVRGLWETRVARAEPVAPALASMFLGGGERLGDDEATAWLSLPRTSPARLHALAAKADLASGEISSAAQHAADAVAANSGIQGELLMGLAHGLRLLADGGSQESLEPALTLYEDYAARTSFAAPYHQGISARLLALLCVEHWLPPSGRDSELAALRSAVESRGVALPAPVGDGIRWAGQTPELEEDPWWSALEEAARRRLPKSGGVWNVLFDHEARMGLAFTKGRGINRGSGGPINRWALVPLEEYKVWVAHRRTADGGLHTTVHTAAQLDGALNGLLASSSDDGAKARDGFAVQAFEDSGPSSALIEPLSLGGTTASLWITQSDVDRYMDPMTRRFQALRTGLLLTALLIVAASAFAWFAMKRGERLRSLRSTFVASVSHDLRTPVAAIGLLAENMAHGYHQGAEDHYVESLQSETARLRRLVDDLLDFGRIEGGLPPLVRRVPVMVSSWIAGFVERERKRCHPLGCALDLVVEGLPESAYLDPAAMERALANLIDNAVKHGGAQSIELRARGAGENLIFEVIDAGSGLSSAALRADLFSPFERGGVQSTGTGLGLSIVEKIALAHGGRATLGPHTDGGAIASVSIALESEESA